ncbi:MAG: hemerythrin family protein [Magnetococcales bacterium]|nr:hemerythrin family protein [Magnetococcales bacterium]
MSDDRAMPSEYWLGNPSIDAQHGVLFAIFDQIDRSLLESDEGGHAFAMDFILSGLRTYVRTHFKFEEILMARIGYVDRSLHAREHRAFEQEVAAIAEHFAAARDDNEKRRVVEETRAFLYGWLGEHIVEVDRKLCAALAAEG